MSHTTCIRQPERSRFLQIHEWQVIFCRNNHCAAVLLAFFTSWHDWKLEHDQYYKRSNDIAEMHGDGRPHGETAYLFFSMEQLIEGCMGFYGKKTINDALDLLVALKVLSIHQNPNPRYHFDKTKYFKFYPEVCNRWIDKNCPFQNEGGENEDFEPQEVDFYDSAKISNRTSENDRPSSESGQPSRKSGQAITNNTNYKTNKNQSINPDENFLNFRKKNPEASENGRDEIQLITDALVKRGFPEKRFQYPDVMAEIKRLHQSGATLEDFIAAYEKALSATQAHRTGGTGFGINYLVKAVEGILQQKVRIVPVRAAFKTYSNGMKKPADTSDFSKAMDWLGDLVD